jgi:hypothetical protein
MDDLLQHWLVGALELDCLHLVGHWVTTEAIATIASRVDFFGPK